MSENELVKFLDSNYYDDTEWNNWFNKEYCNLEKCPTIEIKHDADNENYNTHECAYCEINRKCKFFDFIPNSREIIKLWLEENT